MENEIIDVEYKEIENLEDKTTELLIDEANTFKKQMEMIEGLWLTMALETGKRLLIIKERCDHGDWKEWCEQHLNFSYREATYMMQFAEKNADNNSIFSKMQTFATIGKSKLWALLGAPDEVAEKVMENPEMVDNSVREFKEELKKAKEEYQQEKEAAEMLRRNNIEAQKDIDTYKAQITSLKGQLETMADLPTVDSAELEAKEAEIEKLKDKLAKAKEQAHSEKEKIEAERQKVIEEAANKAKQEAFDEAEAKNQEAAQRYQESLKTIEKLRKSIEQNNNADLAAFKVNAEMLQTVFNSCLVNIDAVRNQDSEQANKMVHALEVVVNAMKEQVA